MKKQFAWVLGAMMAMLLVACASQKGPAEQAVASAETALSAVADQAQKYVPDQYAAVQAQIASAKDSLAKGDYKAVLAAAPAITAAIGSLKDAAAAKAADAEAALSKAKDAWSSVSTDTPKMVEAIQTKVEVLSKSHHLPANISKDSLAAAKSGLDSIKATWADATAAATSGDYTGAMAKAQAVRDKAAEIMKSLGMGS
ncbi:MAG: hypothetical protein JSS29_12310 [Proteobacteria bacterium]|nr:hypothetical protein [Pseudomonadota bacterium]